MRTVPSLPSPHANGRPTGTPDAPGVGVRDKPAKPPPVPSAPEAEAPVLLSTWLSSYGRLTVAVVLLASVLYNGVVTFRRPEVLRGIADLAILEAYRTFVLHVVVPHGRVFTGLLIAFHGVAAGAVVGRGWPVSAALAALVMFLMALVPALGAFNTLNVPFLLLVVLLLLRPYPQTVWEELQR